MTEVNEQQKRMAKIIAKAWADDEYKQRFISDPAAVLKEEGAELPEGVTFKVLEAKENENWIVLPPKPTEADIIEGTDERLAALGVCCCCICSGCVSLCSSTI